MLAQDQRWLLLTMGGWQIVDALIGPGGVSHLMQSRWGGFRQKPIPGAPAWMTSWSTGNGRIVSPYGRGVEPRVAVTAAQINRYAETIPAAIRAQLEDVALQRTQHTWQNRDWCRCGSPDACERDRHHLSQAEVNLWAAGGHRIRAREHLLLAKALGLDETATAGQLELFEVAS